jgi:lysozyme family protein
MEDRAGEIINAVLSQELGDDWRILGDLARQVDTEPKFHLLQQLFAERDITSWGRGETVSNLRDTLWSQIMGDQLPPPIAQAIFHAGLMLGVTWAVQLAQQVAGIEYTDGVMGPRTLEVLNKIKIEEFLTNYQSLVQKNPSSGTAPPMENAATASEQLNQAEPIFKQQIFSNKAFEEPGFAQQTQTANAAPESPFTPVLEAFNVDAIAKKSTSDIWTIEDQLGYASYAQAIAKMIVDGKAQPPLTISIQAPWGQGKTSLMRMIKHKLEHGLDKPRDDVQTTPTEETEVPGTQTKLNHLKRWIKEEAEASDAMLPVTAGTLPCVWFNPLYFQNSNQVWSGLAHTILTQLVDKLPSQLQKERFWFRLQLARLDTHAIRRDIHKLILERWLPKGLVWFGILLLTLAYSLTNTEIGLYIKQHLWPQVTPVIGAVAHLFYQFLNKNKDWALDDKLTKYIKEPDYSKDLGLLHLVDHDLDRSLELLLGEHGRLCVFIDDLDRCTPETVNDILLAINQFISVQHRKIYFILGMDTHMVAMAIETASEKQAATYNKNRHTSKGYGWRFMEKFVQLPFFIPRIQPTEARKYLDTLLREVPLPKLEPAKIENLKTRIAASANLKELREVVRSFKREHQVEILPEVDASVASKMIDITSDQRGETLNKLIAAALSDLELNPREMKRFLNVARLLFIRLDHNEDISSDEHMLKVVRASHLILNWPQCLRWLQGNARSYTTKGDKADPVENLENLFNNPGIDNFTKWKTEIKETWGDSVAETVATQDFYHFTRRIHDNPPNLHDIFQARIF